MKQIPLLHRFSRFPNPPLAAIAMAGCLFAAGCGSPESTSAAPAAPHQARDKGTLVHLADVDAEGVFLFYADVEGELARLTAVVDKLVMEVLGLNPMAGFLPISPDAASIIVENLGLAAVDSFAMSSAHRMTPDGSRVGGFVNKSSIRMNTGKRGLFGLFGSTPHPFPVTGMGLGGETLAAVDFIFSPAALLEAAYGIAEGVGGPFLVQIIEQQLKQPIDPATAGNAPAGPKWSQIFTLPETRFSAIISATGRRQMVEGLDVPEVEFLVRVERFSFFYDYLLAQATAKDPAEIVEFTGSGWRGFTPKETLFPQYPSLQPVLAASGSEGALYLASNRAVLERIVAGKGSDLREESAFSSITSGLPEDGNAFAFVSARVTEEYYAIVANAAQRDAAEDGGSFLPQAIIDALFNAASELTARGHTASVTVASPAGLFSISHDPQSYRASLGILAAYPIAIGAALAIPAFQKVKQRSEEATIQNNLRQFHTAGEMFLLETGSSQATYPDLVGPGKFLDSLPSVAGERYDDLVVNESRGTLSVTLPDGRRISYSY